MKLVHIFWIGFAFCKVNRHGHYINHYRGHPKSEVKIMENIGSSVDYAARQDFYAARIPQMLSKIEKEHKKKISKTHRHRIHEMFAYHNYDIVHKCTRKTWRGFL